MDVRVKSAIALMESNLKQGLKLNHLSKSVNLSRSRLRHLFKDETGLSPLQYLNYLKMERARELLESSFLSIKEILIEVNLNNSSRFALNFKKAYGLTPSAYRTRLRKNPKLPTDSHISM
jgi:AraC family transcriptional regulator of arabinose operon